MSAAVADYAPREPHTHKMKKAGDTMSLELTLNPDLLAELGAARKGGRPVLVGFAVETADDDDVLVAYAQKKLRDKRVDLIVANRAADSFGRPIALRSSRDARRRSRHEQGPSRRSNPRSRTRLFRLAGILPC
jgi:hypothetical protein